MSTTTRPAEDVVASVAKLTIAPASDSKKPKQVVKTNMSKEKEVADSWEDEDISSESDAEDGAADDSRPSPATADLDGTKAPPPTPISSDYKVSTGGTQAPPPTPINPNHQSAVFKGSQPSSISAALAASSVEEQKRPEKTDAAARRMIASALGVKVPRQTEEQKAYDKAMREKERKRREDEREAERKRLEEAENAKRAVWED
ncbi:hypothetical protein RB595_006456 [Gaeumannomyces hyphopodioides]